MKQSRFWTGLTTLITLALLLGWSWRFTSPSKPREPFSKVHFEKHRAQLELLRALVEEDARQWKMDIHVSQEVAQTETKLLLPEERVAQYHPLLLAAEVDSVGCSEYGSRIWVDSFDQKTEYAYFYNGPSRYDFQHGTCVHIRDHWYLYSPS